ncbi:MAG: endonuclease NucS [Nitrososphaerota archaeon]
MKYGIKQKLANYQERIENWIQNYLEYVQRVSIDTHVKEENEGYKFKAVEHFQTNFDLEATEFAGMLESAIPDNNLSVGYGYWPRIMLINYAKMFPEETRSALRNLFDELKDVKTRINEAEDAFKRLNEIRNKQIDKPVANSFIGLRFLSLLLAYRYPENYNPIKPAEWRAFARFINPDFRIPSGTSSGEQYEIYGEYVELLRNHIKSIEKIREIKDAFTKDLKFKDDEYRWMAQDIIYIGANLESIEKESLKPETTSKIIAKEYLEENTGFMPLEEHLEQYIMKNWDMIDFGEKLSIYREEDGSPANQYTTDVGTIDILAKDSQNNLVVIELKRGESDYQVVGQILKYMGWVEKNLATEGQKVRGMIIVGKADETLKSAIMPVRDKVILKEYRLKMNLIEPVK